MASEAMDLAEGDLPTRVDIATAIRTLRDVTRMWCECGRHRDLQQDLLIGRGGARATPLYLRGPGLLSDRGTLKRRGGDEEPSQKGQQRRKLTVSSIAEISRTGPFAVPSQKLTGRRLRTKLPPEILFWACPKYDGAAFDQHFLEHFLRVVTDETLN
eukprot:1815372-Alexandrium_andersonii.AAC.1